MAFERRQPDQILPTATPDLTGVNVRLIRETGNTHNYSVNLEGYEQIVDSIIDITQNESYSVADTIQCPVFDEGYYAFDYVCIIESKKPINIFTSCPFAFGDLSFDQSDNARFNGYRTSVLPAGDTNTCFSIDSIYVDVITENSYVMTHLRENNGTVIAYDMENYITPTSIMYNIADFDNYTDEAYDTEVEYAFSAYNSFNGDFLYEATCGLGYKIISSSFEEHSEVRVRLYKKVSSIAFVEATDSEGEQ